MRVFVVAAFARCFTSAGRHLRFAPYRFVAVALVAAVAAGVQARQGMSEGGASGASVSDKLVPSSGVLIGVRAAKRAGRTNEGELDYLESALGRKFDLDKRYYYWWDTFPSAEDKASVAEGRRLLLSWVAQKRDGGAIRWRDIANGAYDGAITTRADAVKALNVPVMVVFHHEPEDDLSVSGTAADFAAAWRRVVTVFRNRGATNAVWVWNMMAYSFNPTRAPALADYYPGDSYVDWIAADGYNWHGNTYNPGPWRSFAQIFGDFYNWGKARGKPLMVAEWGSLEDTTTPDPQRKANWFRETAATVKTWPAMKALVYFNAMGWYYDSSAQARESFRAMAIDPYFNPQAADSTSPTVQVTAPTNGSTVKRRTTVTITAAAADNAGVARVDFVVNASTRCSDTSPPYSCAWWVASDVGYKNYVRAKAYDAAGNVATHHVVVTTVS